MPLTQFLKYKFKKPSFFKELKITPGWIGKVVLGAVLGRVVGYVLIPVIFGFLGAALAGAYFYQYFQNYFDFPPVINLPSLQKDSADIAQEQQEGYAPASSQEEAVIRVVKEVSPAVVSIVASKDVPVFEQYYANPFEGSPFEDFFKGFEFNVPERRQQGTERREIAAGTGFIISKDGMILTNKHVIFVEDAEYTVYTNEGKKFTAKVLATDPFKDLAILKIDSADSLTVVRLGDSSALQIGQTVIAIGNALGEFRNTVSVGVISGLQRTVTASGGGLTETIEDVIQTDAAINEGNSGGPLLNLRGEVVGINTAIVSGAQNIGFAITINQAKRDIEQVKATGKISYAYLGVWYVMINPRMQELYDLSVDYGAWIGRDSEGLATEESVIPGTAAAKAGLMRDDIILEMNGQKITQENHLGKVIQGYSPGDAVNIKILRGEKELFFNIILGEREG